MGPLVPDIITDELNLVIALLLGIAFGFVLEQAGFSSSKKLTGLFYGTDFTVLRVFFTAGVTAMAGVLLLAQFGWLDPAVIYINPMFLQPAIAGGLIMGVGFVVGGYCPGTSFCGAAVGRIDAMAFAAGGFLGIFAFGEAFPAVQDFYKSGAMGDLLISTALGISPGLFAALMIVVAVAAFVFTTRIEKKVNPESGAFRFPVWKHRAGALALLVLAVVLALVPERQERLEARASDAAYLRAHPVRIVATDELAIHILDRDAKLQLVDIRSSAEFSKQTLPGAMNLNPESLLGKDSQALLDQPRTLKVFFGSDEQSAVRAAALARFAGAENVAALEGGFGMFSSRILQTEGSGAGTNAETRAFRTRAGAEIATLIKQQGAAKPKRALRRVQGGCGG